MKKAKSSNRKTNVAGLNGSGTRAKRARMENLHDKNLDLMPLRENRQMQKDPMKIELILENIFSFCSTSTLKNCRLVSKTWKDCSLKAWREKAVFILSEKQLKTRISFAEYLELLKTDSNKTLQLNKHPFKNFRLQFISPKDTKCFNYAAGPILDTARRLIMHNAKMDFSILKATLFKFHALQTLELKDCKLYGILVNQPVFPSDSDSLSVNANLKRLKISESDRDNLPCVETSEWKCFLQCFPNMESLAFEAMKYDGNEETILKCVRNIRKSGGEHLLSLKELEINHFSTNQNYSTSFSAIKKITECNFPLEKLTFDVLWTKREKIVNIFRPLLYSCKDTLQSWKINFKFQSLKGPLPKPYLQTWRSKGSNPIDLEPWSGTFKMEELKEIRFSNGFPWYIHLLVELELPKLENLILEYDSSSSNSHKHKEMDIDENSVPFYKGAIYENLEVFELHDNCNIPGKEIVETFVRMMPHLSHLVVPLDCQGFQIVCANFKGLRNLNILAATTYHYVELDDEISTGVSKTKKKTSGRRPTNITDLKLLTDLTVSCEAQLLRNDVKFTDHPVTYGFLQLPRLYSLSIAFNGLSKKMEAELMNHVKGSVTIQKKANRKFETLPSAGD